MRGFLEEKLDWDALYCFITHNGRVPIARRELMLEWQGGIVKRNCAFDTLAEAHMFLEDCGAHPEQCWRKRGDYFTPMMFADYDEWRAEMLRQTPDALHVGGVYVDGRHGRGWERARDLVRSPLVVDLDVDETNRNETVACKCGTRKRCCDTCWEQWLLPRARQLMHALCGVMGFTRVLPVYSGRRGLHVWVLDARVWRWTCAQRDRFMAWLLLQVPSGIDAGASGKTNHMCKVPLYPHAETRTVTVPLTLDTWDTFRPSHAPNTHGVTPEQMRAYGDIVKSACV